MDKISSADEAIRVLAENGHDRKFADVVLTFTTPARALVVAHNAHLAMWFHVPQGKLPAVLAMTGEGDDALLDTKFHALQALGLEFDRNQFTTPRDLNEVLKAIMQVMEAEGVQA